MWSHTFAERAGTHVRRSKRRLHRRTSASPLNGTDKETPYTVRRGNDVMMENALQRITSLKQSTSTGRRSVFCPRLGGMAFLTTISHKYYRSLLRPPGARVRQLSSFLALCAPGWLPVTAGILVMAADGSPNRALTALVRVQEGARNGCLFGRQS